MHFHSPFHRPLPGHWPTETFFSIFVLLCFSFAGAKEIPLSGEQDGLFDKGDYVVVKTVTVRKGKTISFAAGSIIRFRPYTGIVVEGSIVCNGEQSSPVVFTSDENRQQQPDRNASPAPFDWNGIELAESADSCVCANVQISYSTFGIAVKGRQAFVKLTNIVFQKNGRDDVAVADSSLSAQDNVPFTYTNAPAAPSPLAAAQPIPSKKAIPPAKPFPWKLTAQIGSGAVAAAGLAIGLYGNLDANKNYSASQSAPYPAADAYWSKMQTSVMVRNIGYAVALAGAAGLGITFLF